MEELGFALDVEDDWPPVGVEHVWCERVGSLYKLKNAPFFIKKLAVDDVFSAEPDAANGLVFEFEAVTNSGHSLVWIMEQDGLRLNDHDAAFAALELKVEHFPPFRHYAVDVPPTTDRHAVNVFMDQLESLGFAMAFPVWRH